MKKFLIVMLCCLTCMHAFAKKDLWPDGTVIDKWFTNTQKIDVATLGRQYVITDYGAKDDSTIVQTAAIQQVIDKAAQEGGGVIVIPDGTFMTGALFFKPGTHLHFQDGGRLKGIDDRVEQPRRPQRPKKSRTSQSEDW